MVSVKQTVTLIHAIALLASPDLIVRLLLLLAQTTHARTVELQRQMEMDVLAHALVVTQETTVRLIQAHVRTIHA